MLTDLNLAVVRHAEGEHQDPTLVVGLARDAELTPRGRDQAAKMGGWMLRNCDLWCWGPSSNHPLAEPTGVYAATTKRALDTGRTILNAMGLEHVQIIPAPELIEQSHGFMEGEKRQEVWTPTRKAELYRLNREDPDAAMRYALPGGESPYDAGMRMLRWTEKLGGMVLAFAHGNATRSMAALINGWPQDQTFPSAVFPNASICLFKRLNGVWQRGYVVYVYPRSPF